MKRTGVAAAFMLAVIISLIPVNICFAKAEVDYSEVAQIQALFDAEPEFYATMLKSLNADADVDSIKESLVAEGNAVPFRLAGGLYHLYDTPEEQLAEVLIQDDYYWVIVFPELNATLSFIRNNGKVEFGSADSGYAYKDDDGNLLTADYSLESAKKRLAAEKGDTSDVLDIEALYLGYSKTAEYIKTEKNEYVIPYVPRPDFSEFNNGQIYDRRETVELLKKMYPPEYFKQGIPADGEEALVGGGNAAEPVTAEQDEPEVYETGTTGTAPAEYSDEQAKPVEPDSAEPEEAVALVSEADVAAQDVVTTGLTAEEDAPENNTLTWVLVACAAALVLAGAVVAAVLIARKKKR